ncbi:hypothetical protein, partial [Psychrobacter aquimaris]|uniref:hypothetical protein n=1 Tax=Psychrobacter aquimaris TaxID=292733 RepID=UPI001868A7F1
YVSNFLAQKYKMKFSQLGEHVKLDLSPEESLESVLSHWSQFSWTIKPLNRAIFPKNVYLTLRGGGGELIRASAASRKAIVDIEKNNSSFSVLDIASQVDDLFDLFVSTDSIPSEYIDKCRVLFSESFIFDKNYSLEQNIDWHYHYYRNRSHFGQYISFYARNEVTFHPLMQKEFFYAANCIDLTARREGKVCYDIIEKLEPQLNKITFDDGFWPHIAYSKEPHLEFLKDDSNKSLKNYYKTQDENAVFLRNPIALNRAENKLKDSFSKHELYIFAINSLFELVYDSKYKVQNVINIINNMNYGKSSSTEIFMKLIDYQNLTKQYRTYCNLLSINKGFERKYLKNLSYVNTEMFLLNYTE